VRILRVVSFRAESTGIVVRRTLAILFEDKFTLLVVVFVLTATSILTTLKGY
jgi:hypothetical protein